MPPPPPPPPPPPGMGGPPPPPPPPPGGLPKATGAPGRGALLGDIQKGRALKKAVTHDRSAPVTGKTSGGGGPPVGGAPPVPGLAPPVPGGNRLRSNSDQGSRDTGSAAASMDAAPQLGGLFAGGMPKLKKRGGVDTGGHEQVIVSSQSAHVRGSQATIRSCSRSSRQSGAGSAFPPFNSVVAQDTKRRAEANVIGIHESTATSSPWQEASTSASRAQEPRSRTANPRSTGTASTASSGIFSSTASVGRAPTATASTREIPTAAASALVTAEKWIASKRCTTSRNSRFGRPSITNPRSTPTAAAAAGCCPCAPIISTAAASRAREQASRILKPPIDDARPKRLHAFQQRG